MIKQSKIRKKTTVDLEAGPRPSRIRRDPPARVAAKKVNPYPSEREVWTVIIGVVLFALAISIITVGFSGMTSETGRVIP